MIIFNHGIVRILVKKKCRNPYYSIITKKVGPLFGPKVEKKFIKTFLSDPVPIENIEWTTGYIEDNIVYYKPHCIIITADKHETEVYFETNEELTKYVDELKEKAPHIIV